MLLASGFITKAYLFPVKEKAKIYIQNIMIVLICRKRIGFQKGYLLSGLITCKKTRTTLNDTHETKYGDICSYRY